MNDNVKIASEMIKIAKDIVALLPYPVNYKIQNDRIKSNAYSELSAYVSELEIMVKMLDKDGSVCRDKMLEVLKNMEAYVNVNL